MTISKVKQYSLISFDFEVGKDWWMITFYDGTKLIQDLENGVPQKDVEKNYEKYVIQTIWNDTAELKEFIYKHAQTDIFLSYNGNGYDKYILKAIWYNVSPQKVNEYLFSLKEHNQRWNCPDLQFKKNVPIMHFDTSEYIGKSMFGQPIIGLKDIQVNLGLKIFESNLEWFDKSYSELSTQDKETITKYNIYDDFSVMMLYWFCEPAKYVDKEKTNLATKVSLCEVFGIDKTKIASTTSSLTMQILCGSMERNHHLSQLSSYHIQPRQFLDTNIKDKELLKEVYTHTFKRDANTLTISRKIDDDLVIDIKEGGQHSARRNYYQKFDNNKWLVEADVDSMYFHLMANPLNPELRIYPPSFKDITQFEQIGQNRLSAKSKLQRHIDGTLELSPEEIIDCEMRTKSFKVPLVGAFGIIAKRDAPSEKWEYGKEICLAGELSLWLFVEMLLEEGFKEIIQTNTDGLLLAINPSDYERFVCVYQRWNAITKLPMSFSTIKNGFICEKDVNHYILCDYDNPKNNKYRGEVKHINSNPAHVNDRKVVSKAVVKYLESGCPIEEFIKNHSNLLDFQIPLITKSKNYREVILGKQVKKGEWKEIKKVGFKNRGFVTKNNPESGIPLKVKHLKHPLAVNETADIIVDGVGFRIDKSYSKWQKLDRPVYIYNDSIALLEDWKSKIDLDYDYYIKLAKDLYKLYTGKEYV